MGYIKINGDDTQYHVTVAPFKTQHGCNAIRLEGEEIPRTDKGFKYYSDEGVVKNDLSKYTYWYNQNEYSDELDEIVFPGPNNDPLGPSAYERLSSRVNQLTTQVNDITPYEETKVGYYWEIEKNFYDVPEGNLTIFFDNYTGEYEVKRVGNKLTVKFPERLTQKTSITVMVQK